MRCPDSDPTQTPGTHYNECMPLAHSVPRLFCVANATMVPFLWEPQVSAKHTMLLSVTTDVDLAE